MKNIYLTISLIISFFSLNSFSQGLPFKYNLNKHSFLAKTNDQSPAGNSVQEIITAGDTIITISKGLNISTDNGVTWSNFFGSSTFGQDGVYAIAYRNGVLWASTGQRYFDSNLQQNIDKGTGLKYTTDLGKTWTSIPQPVDAPGDSMITYGINNLKIVPITVPQENVTYSIGLTSNAVWIASFAAGTRRSTDNGQTWQRMVLPSDSVDHISPTDTLNYCVTPIGGQICATGSYNFEGFSISVVNDSTVYVGTAGGINKTTNADAQYPSWTKFNHTNETNHISGNWVTNIDYNSVTSTLWASTWQAAGSGETNGVSKSTDGGNSWTVYFQDTTSYNFGFKDNQVFVPTDNGLFRSTDNGLNWSSPPPITDSATKIPLLTSIFYATSYNGYFWFGTDDGLVRFDETGGLWQGTWKIYLTSQPLSTSDDTYAYPNPFYPRIDGVIKIKYSTGGQSVPVTIRIFDFGMNYVRTIIQNTQRGDSNPNSTQLDYWDGKDDNHNFVANGVYFYRIDRGSEKPIFGKIVLIQ
jgi:BNR/Asp-box repeat